jgi:hypothetical protein
MKRLIIILSIVALFTGCEEKESVHPLVGKWKTNDLSEYVNGLSSLHYEMEITGVKKDSILIESFDYYSTQGGRDFWFDYKVLQSHYEGNDIVIKAIYEGKMFSFKGQLEDTMIKNRQTNILYGQHVDCIWEKTK